MIAGRLALAASLLLATAAFAGPVTYTANLSGPSEASPNASPGIGFAVITIDDVAHALTIDATFSGLEGFTTAAHIHCCTATPGALAAGVVTQVPSFPGFPLGVQAGTFSNTYDLTLASSWNPSFLNNATNLGSTASAEAALAAGAFEGRAYLNIHSTIYGSGEIRGFLEPVPEPGTWLMAAGALLGLALRRLRR